MKIDKNKICCFNCKNLKDKNVIYKIDTCKIKKGMRIGVGIKVPCKDFKRR